MTPRTKEEQRKINREKLRASYDEAANFKRSFTYDDDLTICDLLSRGWFYWAISRELRRDELMIRQRVNFLRDCLGKGVYGKFKKDPAYQDMPNSYFYSRLFYLVAELNGDRRKPSNSKGSKIKNRE